MRTVTNVFIVNLAVADFLVILICLPPSVIWNVTETWFLGEAMCKIILYFQNVSVTVSVLTLTLISVDRFYAICFPLRYHMKVNRAVLSVSFIWVTAMILDIPEFLALSTKPQKLRYESVLFTECTTTWSSSAERIFYLLQFILLFLLPLLLMIVAYFRIACVLWKSDAILAQDESISNQRAPSLRRHYQESATILNRGTIAQVRARRKAAKMMVVVVIMFVICYFPVHVFNVLRCSVDLQVGELTTVMSLCFHWLCYANSAINPIIYNFMNEKFRCEFRNVFTACTCCCGLRVEDDLAFKHSKSSRRNTTSCRNANSLRDATNYRDSLRQIHDVSHEKKADSNL